MSLTSTHTSLPKPTPLPQFSARFLLPQYWGIWLLCLLFVPTAYLPWPLKNLLGKSIGRLVWLLAAKRRHETLTNLRLCLTTHSHDAQLAIAKACFDNTGIGLLESITGWVRSHYYHSNVSIEGLELVTTLLAQQKGILAIGPHCTILDIGGVIMARVQPPCIMYRPQNNPLLDWLLCHARKAYVKHQVDNRNMAFFKQALLEGNIAWYAPDQDYGLKRGIMAPFFGNMAATVTAQRQLCTSEQIVPVMVTYYRSQAGSWWSAPQYTLTLSAIDQPYPTESELNDATLINKHLERLIRIAPEQYMWYHRRFKTRPTGEPSVY